MILKHNEIRFWQECYLAHLTAAKWNGKPAEVADIAVEQLRARIEDPGPRPDAGRL